MPEEAVAHESPKPTDQTKTEGTPSTAEQVEQLEQLHGDLRQLRARLPELMQTLATPSDDQSSLELFQKVAREAAAWKTEAVAFQSKFKAAEQTMAELQASAEQRQKQQTEQQQQQQQQQHSRAQSTSERPVSPAPAPDVDDMAPSLDYGLDFDDMGGDDFMTA